MKTTLNIPDDLHTQLKTLAFRDRTTMTDLILEGIQMRIAPVPFTESKEQIIARMNAGAVKGTGLQPGIDFSNWEQIRDLIYERDDN